MSSDPTEPAGNGETRRERREERLHEQQHEQRGEYDGAESAAGPADAVPEPAPIRGESNGFSIAAMVCGGLAVLFVPIVLGPIGLILGAVARNRNEPRANMALAIAGGGMVLGFLLGALLLGLGDSR